MRILVTDPIGSAGITFLRERGYEVVEARPMNEAELVAMVGDFDAIIVRGATKVTQRVIDAARRLRVIARAGVGLDNIDVNYARSKGIMVFNTPGVTAQSVAEHTLGLIFCLLRHICTGFEGLKQGMWLKKKLWGREIAGMTIGVIGLGNIGSKVALYLKALGARVIGYRRRRLSETCDRLGIIPAENLDNLLTRSDLITLHVPLTSSTEGLIGRREIFMLKRGSYIVNTSRGRIVDGPALLEALEKGHLGGAALDVFYDEPPKEEWEIRLVNHPRVIATPHLGANTREAVERAGLEAARLVARALEGE